MTPILPLPSCTVRSFLAKTKSIQDWLFEATNAIDNYDRSHEFTLSIEGIEGPLSGYFKVSNPYKQDLTLAIPFVGDITVGPFTPAGNLSSVSLLGFNGVASGTKADTNEVAGCVDLQCQADRDSQVFGYVYLACVNQAVAHSSSVFSAQRVVDIQSGNWMTSSMTYGLLSAIRCSIL